MISEVFTEDKSVQFDGIDLNLCVSKTEFETLFHQLETAVNDLIQCAKDHSIGTDLPKSLSTDELISLIHFLILL
jgi:hypothetical protein